MPGADSRRVRRFWIRALLPVGVSGAILVALYQSIDPRGLGELLRQTDAVGFAVAVGLTAVTVLLSAWRLCGLAAPFVPIPFREAISQILAACSLNLILPSKLGDLAKAFFIRRRSVTTGFPIAGETAFAVVSLEKGADLVALIAWGAVAGLLWPAAVPGGIATGLGLLALTALAGLVLSERRVSHAILGRLGERGAKVARGWGEVRRDILGDPRRALLLWGQSGLLWFLHLLQIWIFIRALGAEVPLGTHLALCPLALLAGLVPFTLAGIGTRDGALVALYAGLLAPTEAVAVGLFCTLRYVLPALAGVPQLFNWGATLGESVPKVGVGSHPPRS